jgi:membrane-bound serine protease (ClpP class)
MLLPSVSLFAEDPVASDQSERRGMQLAIALLVIGFVLMFFEILLPGMVLGACAVLSLIASVTVAYSTNTNHGNIFLIIALVSLAVFVIGFVYWFPNSYMGRKVTSTSIVGDLGIDLSGLINQPGSAYTNLRPSGTAVIGSQRVDVVTEGAMIDKDTAVRVVAVEGNRVVVREI